MKIGTIILCRYSSSRLPGKILRDIEGSPPLKYQYEKFARMNPADCVVIGTSEEASDDVIEAYCQEQGYHCFRGSLNNVAERFLQAARAYGFDYVVRINADGLFIDPETYQDMLAICRTGQYDFITNIKERTFPVGVTVEIVRTDFYESIQRAIQASAAYREHVTLYLYDHPEVGKQYDHVNTKCPDFRGLKIALDEPKDLELAQRIMAKLKSDYYTCSLQQLQGVVESVKQEFEQEGKAWNYIYPPPSNT
ncbi:MAG: hypothetical protein AAFP19_21360 [Bacteroidota bacterium]